MTRLVCVAPNPSIDRLVQVAHLVPGTIHRPTLVRPVAGGKGLNVARAAASLGASVTAVGIVAGHNGRWLAETLEADGVMGRFVWADGETRICTSIADATTGALTELYEAGDAVDEEVWTRFETEIDVTVRSGGVDAVAISGSVPPGAPTDGHARLTRIARAAGVPAAIDGFAPTTDGAAAWRSVLAAGPWLVKANLAEASAYTRSLVAGPDDAIAAAVSMVADGTDAAVVTLGMAGAVAVLDGATWRVGPPPDAGPYPVGSGDAFLAGLLVGRTSGLTTADQLALAAGAGMANARLAGAGTLDGELARDLARTVSVVRVG